MTAPAPSREVAWHEAREEAAASARGLRLAFAWALVLVAAVVAYCAAGWLFLAAMVALWIGVALVRGAVDGSGWVA